MIGGSSNGVKNVAEGYFSHWQNLTGMVRKMGANGLIP